MSLPFEPWRSTIALFYITKLLLYRFPVFNRIALQIYKIFAQEHDGR